MGLKSSEKRVRQSEKRRLRNRMWKSRVKTAIRRLEEVMALGKKEEVENFLKEAVSLIDRAKSKGVFHPNTAARKISRLQEKVNQFLTAKVKK